MGRRMLRAIAKTLLWLTLAVTAVLVLAVAALQIPALRQLVAKEALALVKDLIGYDFRIARVDRLDPWGLRAHGVTARDPDGHDLGEVAYLEANLRPSALLRGELWLTHVVLHRAQVSLPESLWIWEEEPSTPEASADADDGPFLLRIDEARVDQVRAEVGYDGDVYQVDLDRLEGAGRWGPLPALTLGALDVRARDAKGRELVALKTERGKWSAEHGGTLGLVGGVAGAPLRLTAHFGPLASARDGFPEGTLRLELMDVQRATLLPFGVADEAGLVGKHDLDLQLESRAGQVVFNLQTSRSRLELHGLLDAKHVEIAVRTAALDLDSLSTTMPDLMVTGTARLSYGFAESHPPLRADWSGVKLDGQAIPDGSARAEQLGSILAIRGVEVKGFERSLRLMGSVHLETGAVDAELRLSDFTFDRIPWLEHQGIRGKSNADLAFELDGRGGFTGQGFLELERVGYGTVRAKHVQLALGLYGALDSPRGQAELLVRDLSAGKLALHRLSADFDGSPQVLHARLLAHGPDSEFNAFLNGSRPTTDSYDLEGHGNGRVAGQPLNFRVRSFAEAATRAYVGDLWLRSRHQYVRAHGEVDRRGAFRGTLETQGLELAPWTQMAGIEGVRGHLESFTRVAGTTERPLVNVKLTGSGLHAAGQGPFDTMLNFEADFTKGSVYTDAELTSPYDEARANLNVRASFPAVNLADVATVVDRATYELTLRARLPVERIAPLAGPRIAALRGTVDANLDAHGNLDDPHAELALLAQLGLPADEDEPAEVLRAKLTANPEQAAVQVALSDAQGELLSTRGEFVWPGGSLRSAYETRSELLTNLPKFQLRAYLEGRRLDMMQGAVAYLAGVYDLALPIHARALLDLNGEGQRLDGTARAQILVFGDKLDPNCALGSQSRLDLDGALAENRLEFKLIAYTQGGGSVQADVITRLGKNATQPDFLGPVQVRASGREIALSKLPGLCDLNGGKANFFAQGTALGHEAPTMELALDVKDLRTAVSEPLALQLRAALAANAATAKATLRVHDKTAGYLDVSLPLEPDAEGGPRLAMSSPLKARLQLQKLPLAPFLAIGEQLGRARGHANADLFVEGSLAHPRPRGSIEIEQASFAISSVAQPFHGVDARVEVDDHHVVLRRLSAKDLGGTVKIEGDAQLADNLTGKAKISVQADKFPIRRQGVVIGELTTNARIEADLADELQADVRVNVGSGRIWLTGARGRSVQSLDPNEQVRFIDAPAEEVVVPGTEEDGGLVLRSLKLASERDVWLMHKDFSVQVGFDIRLTEDDGPKIEGAATLKRGDLMLLGKSFTLQKGAIRFTGDSPPDPELDLRAVYKPSAGEDLIVQVTGRASSPGLTFSGAATDAGGAVMVLSGRAKAGAEAQAQADAAGFAASVTAGLLSVTARRELGDWVPMLRVETDATGTPARAAAGFDASRLIPPFLDGIAKGAYVEGIVGTSTQNGAAARGQSVGLGVRLELSFPRDLVTTLGYGPGPNWSTDIAWAP